MKRFWTLLLVAAIAVQSLAAQGSSRSAVASATIHVDGQLVLATTTNMNFGTVFANAGVVSSASVPTSALWTGSVSAGANLSVSVAVPATLDDGHGHSLPFSCGSTSAFIQADQSGSQVFNPSSGLSSYNIAASSNGSFFLHLGQDPGNGSCSVNVSAISPAGLFRDYSGSITATITVN